jgi:hypothetical protein
MVDCNKAEELAPEGLGTCEGTSDAADRGTEESGYDHQG